MFGLSAEDEATLHSKIAWAILWQSLPIFLILNFIIPGQSTSYNGSWKISSYRRVFTVTTNSHSLIQQKLIYILIQAPWGKTISYSFGPLLPARICWFFFESPNIFWIYVCWYNCPHRPLPTSNVLLLILFLFHYVQRTVIYPILMSPNTTPMPATVVLAAFCFTIFNG